MDERSVAVGEPSEIVAGEGGTAGEPGAQPANREGSPVGNDATSPGSSEGNSSEGNDVVGLAEGTDGMTADGSEQGAGGSSMAGAAGAGGSSAGVGGAAGGSSMPVGGGAGGSSMPVGGEAPTGAASGGASGSAGASGEGAGSEPDVPVVATVDEFFVDWPAAAAPLTVGLRAAEIFRAQTLTSGSGHDNQDDYKHYKDACAWYGSLAIAQLAGQASLVSALIAKYDPYVGTWGAFNPPTAQNPFAGSIDDSTFGIVPLEIAKLSSDPLYAQEGDLAADHQIAFLTTQLRNSSDDMFHLATLQMQAYRVSTDAAHRQRHMDTAADTMVDYLETMQKDNGLVPHHLDVPGFDVSWSRGNGWFAAGLTELLIEIPSSHRDYTSVVSGYRRMMNGLLQYQIPAGQPGAGLWKVVIDSGDSRNSVETSGSAMFTYAFITGVRQGLLDVETFGPAARAAWLGLVAQLNGSGQIQNVTDWVYLPSSHGYPEDMYASDEENYYFERGKLTGDNQGQAPLMWSAAALIRPLD